MVTNPSLSNFAQIYPFCCRQVCHSNSVLSPAVKRGDQCLSWFWPVRRKSVRRAEGHLHIEAKHDVFASCITINRKAEEVGDLGTANEVLFASCITINRKAEEVGDLGTANEVLLLSIKATCNLGGVRWKQPQTSADLHGGARPTRERLQKPTADAASTSSTRDARMEALQPRQRTRMDAPYSITKTSCTMKNCRQAEFVGLALV
jgi:hypothetical protein